MLCKPQNPLSSPPSHDCAYWLLSLVSQPQRSKPKHAAPQPRCSKSYKETKQSTGGKSSHCTTKPPFAIKIYACFTYFNVTNSPPHSVYFFFLTKAHVYKGGRELQTTVLLTFFCREINAAATVFFLLSQGVRHTIAHTCHHITCTRANCHRRGVEGDGQ